jgi:hypothetical protein
MRSFPRSGETHLIGTYLGRLERIFLRKVNIQKEDTTSIWRPTRTSNGGYPIVKVISLWTSTKKMGVTVG